MRSGAIPSATRAVRTNKATLSLQPIVTTEDTGNTGTGKKRATTCRRSPPGEEGSTLSCHQGACRCRGDVPIVANRPRSTVRTRPLQSAIKSQPLSLNPYIPHGLERSVKSAIPRINLALVEVGAPRVRLDYCRAAHHGFAAFFNSCKASCPVCCQYRAAEGRRVGSFGQFERDADRVRVNRQP